MIYCVEDERNIRELLVYTLETTGFEAIGIQEGKELFRCLEKELPDLILLDIMLPGQDGYSILEKFCWSALENAGLELYAGLLHVDRPGKPSLVLDFMEEYRAWVVDRNIIKLRARLGKETSLTPDLKTEIINGIDATMSAFITHRGKKVRLENIMQRQAYRLAGAMTDGKRYKSIRFKW